jgi:hypothetical protein
LTNGNSANLITVRKIASATLEQAIGGVAKADDKPEWMLFDTASQHHLIT